MNERGARGNRGGLQAANARGGLLKASKKQAPREIKGRKWRKGKGEEKRLDLRKKRDLPSKERWSN